MSRIALIGDNSFEYVEKLLRIWECVVERRYSEAFSLAFCPVTVLCRKGGMVGENDFFSDELTNMPVEDAIYNRTQIVSDMIGVEFIDIKMSMEDLLKEMTLQMNTGDPTYDIVECSAWRAIAYIVQGYMRDIITEGGEYIDLDSPWTG